MISTLTHSTYAQGHGEEARIHEPDQLGRKIREPIALPLPISVLDGEVLSFYVATLAQSQAKCLGTGGLSSWIGI
jgi:hypothetical protein